MVAWWPFSSTTDNTGHGHDLTNAGVVFADPVATFDNNDNLNTPDAADLDEIRTVAFWVRSSDTGRAMGLVCRSTTWGLGFTSGLTLNCNMGGSRVSTTIASGSWTTLRAGPSVGAAGGSASLAGTTGITIGEPCTVASGTDELRGSMSDVRLYRRVLSDSEIASLAATPPP